MNSPRWTLTLLAIAVNCWINVPVAWSQNPTDQWVEKAARPLVENRVVVGMSVGYIDGKHHGIVHLGSSNRDGKRPDDSTLYEIGSVSKVFTSLMLADAVVRGDIDLNATADVPNAAGIRLPSRDGRSIKWIDLSTHRSGLPRLPSNFVVTSMLNPYRDYDSKKAAAFLKEYELPRQPGEKQEYSNLAVSVLGYLVAQKAGKSYQDLLRERIAEPLGMTDCTVELSEDQTRRLATPYDQFGRATSPWTDADLPGAGGIHATIRDMMGFAQAQLTPPPGKVGEAIELAWKQQRNRDASGPAMGLAWMIKSDQTRWHNGQTGGSHASIFINRKLNRAAVVLCNSALDLLAPDKVDQLALQLIQKGASQDLKLELGETSDQGSGALSIDAKLRGRLVGQYQVVPGIVFNVRDRDGHLMVDTLGQPAEEAFPDSPTRWSFRAMDASLEFKLGKTGPAKSLVFHQNQTANRIEEETKAEAGKTSDQGSGTPALDAKLRHRLEGRYQVVPNFVFTVRDRDGHMMVDATGQPAQEVFPDSATQWSYRGVDTTLEFKLDKTGHAKSLVLHANQTAYRIEEESKPETGATSGPGSANPAIDAKLRHRLEGRYQLARNFVFTVRDRDGHLIVEITGQPAQEVFPDSPTRWSYRGIDAKLEFKLKKTGPATSLVLHQNGIQQTARRINEESTEQNQGTGTSVNPGAERSPFAAVRWQQSQPQVKVGGEWFKLVSLDGIPATKILAFSKRTYGTRWQMRFEEDLVALLTRMGHPPGDTVTLAVRSLRSSERRTLKSVPMTEENRQAIKEAAKARQNSQP